MSDEKTSISRLAKAEKAEFTGVNEHFSDERNEEIGVFAQTLIKKPISGCNSSITKKVRYY